MFLSKVEKYCQNNETGAMIFFVYPGVCRDNIGSDQLDFWSCQEILNYLNTVEVRHPAMSKPDY